MTPENDKLAVLARATRARAGAPEGAAVRDATGRTYAAATVDLGDPALSVSALRAALVLAVASGARSFEAAVVVTEATELSPDGPAALEVLCPGTPVYVVSADPPG
jgi:cytidine deaminase